MCQRKGLEWKGPGKSETRGIKSGIAPLPKPWSRPRIATVSLAGFWKKHRGIQDGQTTTGRCIRSWPTTTPGTEIIGQSVPGSTSKPGAGGRRRCREDSAPELVRRRRSGRGSWSINDVSRQKPRLMKLLAARLRRTPPGSFADQGGAGSQAANAIQ